MNDEIRDPEVSKVLDQVTPHRDAPTGLLAGARRKRQQRRILGGGAAALLTVALMVPVVTHLLSQENITTTPATTPTPVPEEFAGLTNPCLDSTTMSEAIYMSDPPEQGAQRAWLCGDYHQASLSSFSGTNGAMGPLEPLVNDADRLIEEWEGFEPLPPDIACTMEYTLTYTVIFDYEDGTQRALQGELHGCRSVGSGEQRREGGEELFNLAIGLWEDQREAYPDLENPYVPCQADRSLMDTALEDVNRGAVCTIDETGMPESSALSDELVARIRDALITEAETLDPMDQQVTEPRQALELATGFADPLRLVTNTGEVYEWWDGDDLLRWEPSAELQDSIAVALDEVGTGGDTDPDPGTTEKPPVDPVDPPEAAQPWLPEACLLTGDGVITSPVPAEGTPDEIWLCPAAVDGLDLTVVPPAEPLVLGVDQAVAALRGLEPMNPEQGCTADLGPAYYVVHNYPDGTQHVVEYQDYGCRGVTAGDDVLGGTDYFDTLKQLWQDQRSALNEPVERPAPLCPDLFATMPVSHTDEFVAGSLCDLETDLREIPIAPEVVEELNGQLDDASDLTDFEIEYLPQQLVLVNYFGDPYTLLRTTEGWIYQGALEGPQAVTFTPELQAQLDDALQD